MAADGERLVSMSSTMRSGRPPARQAAARAFALAARSSSSSPASIGCRYVSMSVLVGMQRLDVSLLGESGGAFRAQLGARIALGQLEQQGEQMTFGTLEGRLPPLSDGHRQGRGHVQIGAGVPQEFQCAYVEPAALRASAAADGAAAVMVRVRVVAGAVVPYFPASRSSGIYGCEARGLVRLFWR